MTENELKYQLIREDDARRAADLKDLLSRPEGRRILMHLVTASGIYRTSEDCSQDRLAYLAGRRDIGLEFLSACNRADSRAVAAAHSERETMLSERASRLAALRQNLKKDT